MKGSIRSLARLASPRAGVGCALVSAFLLLAAPAAAAVTVSAGATLITIEGSAGNDATVVSDEGSNVRITNATAQGANCTQSGTDALCPRGSRTISANLLGGDDDFDNRSSAVAGVTAGPGADMLIGRLLTADAGDGLDIMRPSGMTGVVSLAGGAEFDIYDIGADTGASDVVTDTGAFMVDYLSRPPASGGVTLTPNNDLDDDGAAGEFDDIRGATFIRGTVGADTISGTAGNGDVVDGDLGADVINGGDDVPTGGAGVTTLPGDAVVFGMDAHMPYPRPASSARTQGVHANLAAGSSSDGDTLARIDDLRGTPFNDVLTATSDRDVVEAGAGSDQVSSGGESDTVTCDGLTGSVLAPLRSVAVAHGTAAAMFANQCALTVDAGDGSDVVRGGAFNDTLRGGPGDDDLHAAAGDDMIVGGAGTDALHGADGIDTVSFEADPAGVAVDLSSAIGQEVSGGSFENAIGSPFNDIIAGTTGANVLDGSGGIDTVSYAGRVNGMAIDLTHGTVTPIGAAQPEDTIAGFESAAGGNGGDRIIGDGGQNGLVGNDGNDSFIPGFGPDIIVGGSGTDSISFGYLGPALAASQTGITHRMNVLNAINSEGDISHEVEELVGSVRDDVLIGTSGDDSLSGANGDDRIVPGGGADTVTGGAGEDTLDYAASAVAIHADLQRLRVTELGATQITDTTLDGFENLIGSPFADVLRGTRSLAAGSGVNEISGRGGSDVIDGRSGDDTLRGEGGHDRFGTIAETVPLTARASSVTVGNFDTGGTSDETSNTIVIGEGGDGRDTVLGGPGDDDVNVRDAALDELVDCGDGTDIARQDLRDDEGNLQIDRCETTETAAIDQLMTVVRSVRKRGRVVIVRLSCPKRSKVTCKGRAGLVRTRSAKAHKVTRYRIARGRTRLVTVRGRGRYLVLSERDQRRRLRHLVRRL